MTDSARAELCPSGPRLSSRRHFLGLATGVGGYTVLQSVLPSPLGATEVPSDFCDLTDGAAAEAPAESQLWSDPETWGGTVPGAGDVAHVTGAVVLDVDAVVAGVEIAPGASLTFDPATDRVLASSGNVVVRGTLRMRPAGDHRHKLRFTDVNEASFVGGGLDPLPTDVGLWVIDGGRLDVAGSHKIAWRRAAGSLVKGTRTVVLDGDPTGWKVGDEIMISPTASPRVYRHYLGFEVATITAISGRTLQVNRPLDVAHPATTVRAGRRLGAEVVNLTRTVMIEGAPKHRAHVFIRSSQTQSICHAALRHMGPRQPWNGETAGVLGRYGLHFHHCMDGSRGTVVEGVVVRDCGNHSFVPHMSHGITLRDCVAFNVFDDAYWWDMSERTHDLVLDRCVAALVQCDPPFRGFTLSGFSLSKGSNNVARRCTAVGVQGNSDACGIRWPATKAVGSWLVEDCVTHNNKRDGAFTWDNAARVQTARRVVSYHNGRAGLYHGAYQNSYRYEDWVLYGNDEAAVIVKATAKRTGLFFTRLYCDGAGLSDYVVKFIGHLVGPASTTTFRSCTFRGYRRAALGWPDKSRFADHVDLVLCAFSGNAFWLGTQIASTSRIRVQGSRSTLQLVRRDRSGSFVARWNARVSTIRRFA